MSLTSCYFMTKYFQLTMCVYFREYSVGFEVTAVSCNVPGSFTKQTSGDFRLVNLALTL